ncbi:hypothetical protein TWF730_006209 [Orbilia blumenaviensis]|uniref:Uncharacterized protein n=1 Tax=Orbilia blumenaviensis TaxID=1796055 RepID=A0AAV9VJY2_9PEZI
MTRPNDPTITATVRTHTTNVTKVLYSTYTTILNDTAVAELAAEWSKKQGLTPSDKIAIAIGTISLPVWMILIAWSICLKRRNTILISLLQSAASTGGNEDYFETM